MAVSKTSSDQIWQEIKKYDIGKQRKSLEAKLQAREPIRKFSDMKVGDHLIRKTSLGGYDLYHHHFLCIGSEGEGRPTIIHYSNTPINALLQFVITGCFASGSALAQLGIVQELTLPHKDFIESESKLQEEGAEVERVVWPDELKRYPVKEVIKRARKRKGEKCYHLAKNNCESFVMWCLCDLNISLQSTPLIQSLTKTAEVVIESIQKKGLHFLCRHTIAKEGIKGILGVFSTALIEVGNATCSIIQAKEKWDVGSLIKSREEFIKEVVDVVLLALSSCGVCIAAIFVGQYLIPIPFVESLIGLLAATLFAHIGGEVISQNSSSFVASVVDMLMDYAGRILRFWAPRSPELNVEVIGCIECVD